MFILLIFLIDRNISLIRIITFNDKQNVLLLKYNTTGMFINKNKKRNRYLFYY